MRKYNREIVRKLFLERNLEWLEGEYKNFNTPMEYRCLKKGCNYISKMTLHSVSNGSGCRKCGYKKVSEKLKGSNNPMYGKHLTKETKNKISKKSKGRKLSKETRKKMSDTWKAKPKKYNTEEIKEKFLEKNLEWLEKEYINSSFPMKYICKNCGYKGKKSLNSLRRFKSCSSFCSERHKKYNIKIIEEKFLEKNLELLEKEYKNVNTPMKYRCLVDGCNYEGKITLSSILRGSGCFKCGHKRGGEKLKGRIVSEETRKKLRKYDTKIAKEEFLKKNLEILEDKYVGIHIPMKYRCLKKGCGYEGKINLNHVLRGHGCRKCGYKIVSEKLKGDKCYFYGKHHTKIIKEKISKAGLGRKLSEETKAKMSEAKKNISEKTKRKMRNSAKKGPQHPNYNFNLTDKEREIGKENRKLNYKFVKWSKKVKIKGNYTCKKCDKIGGRLNSHHKNSWATYKKQRYDINNGVCLCQNCHNLFHKIYTKKNNTEEQFNEFLKIY